MGRTAFLGTSKGLRASARVALCAAVLMSLSGPMVAQASIIPADVPITHAYGGFVPTGMEAFGLGGSASVAGGAVRLTPAAPDQLGTMFTAQPLRIRNSGEFSTCFSFRIDGSSPTTGGAEGLTFVMASDKDSLVPSGLGFTGGGGTMRVEFDTHKDPWDANDNHITFWPGGDESYHDTGLTLTPAFDLDDGGVKYCWIDYQSGVFRIAFSDTPTRVGEATSCSMTAGYMGGATEADVYFGFTGTTSTEYANHEIVSWYLDNKYHPAWIAALDPATRSYSTGPATLECASADRVGVDASTELTFTVTDGFGAPMANQAVGVTASAGSLSSPAVVSDANGLATVTFTAPATRQACTITGETAGGLRAVGSVLVGDERPVVDAGTGTTQAPRRTSTTVAPELAITDSDDTTLTAARVRILDREDGDEWLSFRGWFGDQTPVYDPGYECSLQGAATIADYERALSAIEYQGSPSVSQRQVEFSVFDGIAWSDPVVKTIEVGPMAPVAGADRYQTALEVSRETFPLGANTVVVATGEDWPDALGGSALAGALYGPILLSPHDALPEDVLAEVERLHVDSAYVLGGEKALSDEVLTALTDALGEEGVVRLGGADRYETAEIIAAEVASYMNEEEAFAGTAFIATGGNFADALAAAPLAAGNYYPIYLSGPDGISDSTAQAMLDAGITDAILLGGEAAVSPDTAVTVLGIGIDVYRIDGADRYETAAKIASYGVEELGMYWDGVAVATGERFADALSGGAAQGISWSVMLLSDPDDLSLPARDTLEANAADIRGIRFLGGTKALSQNVRDQAMEAIAP